MLPVGICVGYVGAIAHAAHQVKQEQKRLTHTPENIYQLADLYEQIPMLDEGSVKGGDSDNGNGKTFDHGSWYKNKKFKIAVLGLGASIVAGMMKYFNQPEKQESNSVEQLLDYLYEPAAEKFGKDADKYWHDTRNYTEFNDGTFSLARIVGKSDKSAVVKATYDYYDRKNRSNQPDAFEFMVWHNTCDQEMYDKLQARKQGKNIELELPLKAFCDVSSQAYKEHNRVVDYKGRDEKRFSIDAGKYGKYICRTGHLGISNLSCDSEKEWEYLMKRAQRCEAEEKKMNEESLKVAVVAKK